MALLCKFRISVVSRDFMTDPVARVQVGAAEGISAVMSVVNEVPFETLQFPVGHVLRRNRIFSPPVSGKFSVVVGQWA